MNSEFSIFARFNSIDPLYSTLDTGRQPSNLTKNDNACSTDYAVYILPGRQEHGVLSSRKKRICDRQAATIMKAHIRAWGTKSRTLSQII